MAKPVRLLVVAGGGEGSNSSHRGGGGAGGFQDIAIQQIDSTDYAITVGNAAEDSSFGTLITSLAGGDGGVSNGSSSSASPGEVGGSGGGGGGKGPGSGSEGAGGLGTAGQGSDGGSGSESTSSGPSLGNNGGGGGGGAGGGGANAAARLGGNGGAGLSSDITGTPVTYAEGGGGDGGTLGAGTGGGSQANTGNGGNNSVGGTGVVIVRYLTTQFGKCSGGTITTDGLYTVHRFTSSGIFSVSDVVTNAVTAIGFTDATGNGETIVAIGVTIVERGVVWATTANPTTADGKATAAGTSGAYTAAITGLSSSTLYHARAYSIDSLGNITYGVDVTFTTASIANDKMYKDLGASDGDIFAVRFTVGGALGSVDVQLGSTATPQNFAAGAGVQTFVGTYSGLYGLIFDGSATFNGYIDDVMFVKLLNVGQLSLINWLLDALITPVAIASSVVFKRIEDQEFNRFRFYRYLDSLFKDVDGYVTVTIRREANDGVVSTIGTFLVGGTDDDVSPFVKKRISFLAKVQALLIGYSNANLNDQFIITKFQLSGSEEPKRQFDGGRIISID